MNTTCAQCGLPVYFAERKTSLGRNWHRACLRCEECQKVLAPGQHAEHKGKPYCHNPCYKALFGPAILGYGSNLSSPANYARRGSSNGSPAPYDDDDDDPNKTEIFTFSVSQHSIQMERHLQKKKSGSPAHQSQSQGSQGQGQSPSKGQGQSPCKGRVKGQELGQGQRQGSNGDANSVASRRRDSSSSEACNDVSDSKGDSHDSRVSPRHEKTKNGANTCATNGYAASAQDASSSKVDPYEQEMQEKVEEYNRYYTGKRRHQITVENHNGDLRIEGPLRIYWGVNSPIRLRHCDDVPAAPSPSWRHSLYPTQSGSTSPDDKEKQLPPSPSRRGVDDSFLSPSMSGVVMRRKNNIRKFNTVAYRGDRPTKWKRASINGHIYNYDTSVFTPVIGSCTSVSITSYMTAPDVIKALLEKFKVENSPDEYYLAVSTDDEGERILTSVHYPLLERIHLGPDESHAKIFIKEKEVESPSRQSKSVAIEEEEEEEEQHLPHEVEELLVLPEAVLTGILQKFRNDEERAVQKIAAKYERVRKMIMKRMEYLKTQAEQGGL